RLLAGDAELSQQSTNRIGAQRDGELILDQFGHHLARPQRKRKLQLQGILLRHGLVNPLYGARTQFGRSSKQRLGLQRSPSTSPILRQPSIYSTAVYHQRSRHNLGIFASLYATHGADTHRFQRRVIQFASIILFHAALESHRNPRVKKKVKLLMYRLIAAEAPRWDRSRRRAYAKCHGVKRRW